MLSAKVLPAVLLLAAAFALPAHAEGDAAAGEKVFKKCMACHKVGDGAKNGAGPVLNGLIGRTAGTAEGFSYSKLNHNAGANGLVWTEQTVFDYLADPNAFLKKFLTDAGKADEIVGGTKMAFKLAPEADRQNVIAYLKQFSPAQ
ncbi:MAG: c-type cytochrome [Hyphomicrobiaceae bacterium]